MSLVRRLYAARFSPRCLQSSGIFTNKIGHQLPFAPGNWRDLMSNGSAYAAACRTLRPCNDKKNLPSQFTSWQAFKATIAVMDRQTVQQAKEALCSTTKLPSQWALDRWVYRRTPANSGVEIRGSASRQ